jgi:hypothetical protein
VPVAELVVPPADVVDESSLHAAATSIITAAAANRPRIRNFRI